MKERCWWKTVTANFQNWKASLADQEVWLLDLRAVLSAYHLVASQSPKRLSYLNFVFDRSRSLVQFQMQKKPMSGQEDQPSLFRWDRGMLFLAVSQIH